MKRLLLATFGALLVTTALLPAGQVFLQLKSNRANLSHTGDSDDPQFPAADGWIKLHSATFGVSNVAVISGPGGGGAGKAKFEPCVVAKPTNHASIALLNSCVLGLHWDEIELVFTTNHLGTTTATLRAEFKLVFTESSLVEAAGGDPEEDVTFAYGAQRITVYRLEPAGGSTATGSSTWSQVLNRPEYITE
jgi:type VI protein secretion system component Hcp